MKVVIEHLVDTTRPLIEKNITTSTDVNDIISEILAAYNRYQKDECDGRDYIYNIFEQKDLEYLVTNGLINAKEITRIVNHMVHENYLPYIYCGYNYDAPHIIGNLEDLKKTLISWLDIFLPFVFLYATRYKEYQALYKRYITEPAEEEMFC